MPPPAGASPASNPGRSRTPRTTPSRHRLRLVTLNAAVVFTAPGDHRTIAVVNARAVAAAFRPTPASSATRYETLESRPPDLQSMATIRFTKSNRYGEIQTVRSRSHGPGADPVSRRVIALSAPSQCPISRSNQSGEAMWTTNFWIFHELVYSIYFAEKPPAP